jgi:hypothetical protein
MSQENSLHSYLYLKLKCYDFILSFLFPLQQNRRTGGHNKSSQGRELETVCGVELLRKRVKRVNLMQKMCSHVNKCKNGTCWSYSGNWGREEWRSMVEETNLCMMYLIYYKNLCKWHNVLPPITKIKEKNQLEVFILPYVDTSHLLSCNSVHRDLCFWNDPLYSSMLSHSPFISTSTIPGQIVLPWNTLV